MKLLIENKTRRKMKIYLLWLWPQANAATALTPFARPRKGKDFPSHSPHYNYLNVIFFAIGVKYPWAPENQPGSRNIILISSVRAKN